MENRICHSTPRPMNVSAQRRGASSAQRDLPSSSMTELNQDKINLRMDELVREYGKTLPGDPRRADIANEISELCLILFRLRAKEH